LYAVLKLFADAEINLTRIASMPLRSDPGNYSFFLDFEGSAVNPKVAAVLKEMENLTKWMRYLGSYPAEAKPL
jgi:prephenate dehydratase